MLLILYSLVAIGMIKKYLTILLICLQLHYAHNGEVSSLTLIFHDLKILTNKSCLLINKFHGLISPPPSPNRSGSVSLSKDGPNPKL